MLQAIDTSGVFDRSTSLNLFLLLDGHRSWFEHNFWPTKLDVCVGLPYGTSYWQVGDSTEQNGCFKMSMTKAKQELVQKKYDCGLNFEINKEDVVGLVKQAWINSFAHTKTNWNAILNWGWGPKALNYNVLCHKEVASMQKGPCNSLPTTDVTENEINLTEGLSGTLVDQIVIHRNREALTGEDALDQMRKRKATANEQIMLKNKRMTTGLLASSCHFCLSNKVCQYVQEKANTEKNNQIRANPKKKN
jgi:hypothetical protein